MRTALGLGLAFLAMSGLPSSAAGLSVAVAANFTVPAEEIARDFTAATGNEVALSFGSTGTLYTQATQGAPFEVFLSADNTRPEQAVKDGIGVDGTVFTYAVGTLVLYSPSLDLSDGEAVLAAGAFNHIAIADPATAPYGAAAVQTLDRLGLAESLASKEVVGENVTQTQQFIVSGNAELGFLALSQVAGKPPSQVWTVPADLYSPILQDAVLLQPGADDAVARQFIDYLKGPEARSVIEKYGYALADD